MSFNHKHWTQNFVDHPGYNDSQITVNRRGDPPKWAILGIHQFSPADAPAVPIVYVQLLDADNKPVADRNLTVNWAWLGLLVSHDSPPQLKIPADPAIIPSITLYPREHMGVWMDDGDLANALDPNESYYIVFRRIEGKPSPIAQPDPNRVYTAQGQGLITFKISKAWFNSLPEDDQGAVTLHIPIYK